MTDSKRTTRPERPVFSGIARAEGVYEEQEADRQMWEYSIGEALAMAAERDIKGWAW